jgi:hypothetical protein
MIILVKGRVTDIQIIETRHIDDYSGNYSGEQSAVLQILTSDNIQVKCKYGKNLLTLDLTNAECEKFKKEILQKFSINDNVIAVGYYEADNFIFDAFYNKSKNRVKYKENSSIDFSLAYFFCFLVLIPSIFFLFDANTAVNITTYIWYVVYWCAFVAFICLLVFINDKKITNNINAMLLKTFEEKDLEKNNMPLTETKTENDNANSANTPPLEGFETEKDLTEQINFYMQMGKYLQAESLCERSLAILEKTVGKYHPDFAKTLNNLVEIYKKNGKFPYAPT